MFELSDSVIEEIVFGMENQACDSYVDIENGEVHIVAEDQSLEDYLAERYDADPDTAVDIDRFCETPDWTSQDGYRLMEDFARSVPDAMVRSELLGALGRGKGVFRAFKNALDTKVDLEKRWYEFKEKAMRRVIVDWYDDLREAQGLERLGPEPEETDELLLLDFQIREGGRELWRDVRPIFKTSLGEALERFPEALVEYEYTRLEREIEDTEDKGLRVIVASALPGEVSGVAVARTLFVADRSFGKVVYLFVQAERRRQGLGRRLVEAARESFARDGVRHLIIDMPFLGQEFGDSLATIGYNAFGARWMRAAED